PRLPVNLIAQKEALQVERIVMIAARHHFGAGLLGQLDHLDMLEAGVRCGAEEKEAERTAQPSRKWNAIEAIGDRAMIDRGPWQRGHVAIERVEIHIEVTSSVEEIAQADRAQRHSPERT